MNIANEHGSLRPVTYDYIVGSLLVLENPNFFSQSFWFSRNHTPTGSRPTQMSSLINVALVVPIKKTSTDGDFEPALMFNLVVVNSLLFLAGS
jgi:hypothetical protein